MDNLKEKLWDELEKLDKEGKLSAGDLELAHKLTDTIKNLDKICLLEDEMDDGYSGRDGGMNDNRGSSRANRGKHLVRSHYSRAERRDGRGYSRADGRSKMMEHLEMALDSADEQDRDDILRFMRKLENA